MFSAFQYDAYVWYGLPEHLDEKKIPPKTRPSVHKTSEKRTLTNYFFFYLALYPEIQKERNDWSQ